MSSAAGGCLLRNRRCRRRPHAAPNTYQTLVSLAKGTYQLEFDEVDLVGNTQVKAGFAQLVVK